jgi:hypothetical protein
MKKKKVVEIEFSSVNTFTSDEQSTYTSPTLAVKPSNLFVALNDSSSLCIRSTESIFHFHDASTICLILMSKTACTIEESG